MPIPALHYVVICDHRGREYLGQVQTVPSSWPAAPTLEYECTVTYVRRQNTNSSNSSRLEMNCN